MISSYLAQPIRPLAVALSCLLAQIDAELANEKMSAAEKWRAFGGGLIARGRPDHLTHYGREGIPRSGSAPSAPGAPWATLCGAESGAR